MLKVGATLIKKDEKILIAQRLKGKYEDMWEFPGGKVEPGETEEQAIEREIMEEFNIEVRAKEFIKNSIYETPSKIIDLRLYGCDYISGKIEISEHKQYKWIDKKDIFNYDLAPADIELAEHVKKL